MLKRRDIASWLQGPAAARPEGTYVPQPHPGARLGLPEHGPGSLAGVGRRLAALAVDWFCCVLVARPFTDNPAAPLGVFVLESVLLVSTLGATFGMALLRLRVVRLGAPGLVSPARVLLRTLLLAAVIPAVVWDRDGRGLHDRAAGTAVVRAR